MKKCIVNIALAAMLILSAACSSNDGGGSASVSYSGLDLSYDNVVNRQSDSSSADETDNSIAFYDYGTDGEAGQSQIINYDPSTGEYSEAEPTTEDSSSAEPDNGDDWYGSENWEETMREQSELDERLAQPVYYEDYPKVPEFGHVAGFELLRSYCFVEDTPSYGMVYEYGSGHGYTQWEKDMLEAGFELVDSTDSAALLSDGGGIASTGENSVTVTRSMDVLYQNFTDYQRVIISPDGKDMLERYMYPQDQQSASGSGQSGGGSYSGGGSGFNYDYSDDSGIEYGTDFFDPYADDYQSDSDYDYSTDTWYDDDIRIYNPYGDSDNYDDNYYDADGDNDGFGW